jgi:uncharacterized hydrophobic protein (TIGR00271 family)
MKKLNIIQRYIRSQFRLPKEEEFQETYDEIAEGAEFKGSNLWILGFTMIIACIGLNIDSPSAVIGAMLISPLMGPIVAVAFGMAINDTKMKQQGIKNWLLMMGVSLLASVLYFLISPFENNTSTLLSFEKATIFDILLAFFGGMAGFIGTIKKEGTKVIAGVAVATACMPPLCTAGYGIVHFDYMIFIGGLYFYFINCLFIGVATFIAARLTGFNESNTIFGGNKTHVWLWNIFIVLMILPSVYIAYQKWEEQHLFKTPVTADQQRIEELERKVYELDSLVRLKK